MIKHLENRTDYVYGYGRRYIALHHLHRHGIDLEVKLWYKGPIFLRLSLYR